MAGKGAAGLLAAALATCLFAAPAFAKPGSTQTLYRLAGNGATLQPDGKNLRFEIRNPASTVDVVSTKGDDTDTLAFKSPVDFVRSWKRYGFERNPPIAAIRDRGAARHRDLVLVRLSNPRVKGGGVSFDADLAEASEAPRSLERFANRADPSMSTRLGGASALISSGSPEKVFGQITWTFPAATWGSIFASPATDLRVIGLNPFGGGPVAFGQNPTGFIFDQFFLSNVTGVAGTGYLTFVVPTQGGCVQLDPYTNPPTPTALLLQIGSKSNNVSEGPFKYMEGNSNNELCL